jgi:nucleotide-binding universal stress UspA family protein
MAANSKRIRRIAVGIDGSEHAAAALDWAIQMARGMGSEVIVIYAVPPPSYYGTSYAPPVEFDPEWRAEVQKTFEGEWSRPLNSSGVPFKTVMEDGRPASVIAEVAQREGADMVVVGRRGRGGFAELVLGSVSHELTHYTQLPILLISG